MNNQLIIIEGLPGSGKTTTATLISQHFNDKNIKANCYLEGDLDHPADYEGVAYFKNEAFKKFVDQYNINNILMKYSQKHKDGYLIYYLKYKEQLKELMSLEAYKVIKQQDIYNLQLKSHMKMILDRWETFVEQVKETNERYIFECCFLQNPITMTMIKENIEQEYIKQYIYQIHELIKPLNPLLIYLEQDDIEASFKKIIDERSKRWQDFFIDYYTTQNYGRSNDYTGLNGTIEILKDRQKLEKTIIKTLPMKKLIINNTDYDSYRILDQLQSLDV